jgi:hypothetical protein
LFRTAAGGNDPEMATGLNPLRALSAKAEKLIRVYPGLLSFVLFVTLW